MKNFENFKNAINGIARTVCIKTDNLATSTKLALETESQKRRLSKAYEKIGESVVSCDFEKISENSNIAEYIKNAKEEKDKLKALYEKKKDFELRTDCTCCGREGKKGEFCRFCGEYLK